MTTMDDQRTSEFFAAICEDQNRSVLATIWLRLLAMLGDVKAQFVIGRTLMYGSGLSRPDPDRARTWLLRAARRGHPEAAQYLEILTQNSSSS